MERQPEKDARARVFVLAASLISAAVVWAAVVKSIGYSLFAGILYFIGYSVAMILFLDAMGFRVFGEGE